MFRNMEPAIQQNTAGSKGSNGLATAVAGTGTITNTSAGRRQKRPAAPATTATSSGSPSTTGTLSRPLPPLRPYLPRPSTLPCLTILADAENPPLPPPAPAKRGRKPGPLSRSAREAQRRLNHSIIEKARRTKINEALADLKSLVPMDSVKDLGVNGKSDDEDDDNDDDDYAEANSKSTKGAGKPKKEQKEKEFKLEILIRTVAYLRTLIARVALLEAGAGSTAGTAETSAALGLIAGPNHIPGDITEGPSSLVPNSTYTSSPSQSVECPTCKLHLTNTPSISLPDNFNRAKKRRRSTSRRTDDGYASDKGGELSNEDTNSTFPLPSTRPLKRRARLHQGSEDIEMKSNSADVPGNDRDIHTALPLAPSAAADPVTSPSNPSSAPIPQPLPPLSAWLACVLDSTSDQPTRQRLPEPKKASLAYPSPPESGQTGGEWNRCREERGNVKGLPYLNLGPRAIITPSSDAGESRVSTQGHILSNFSSRPTPPHTPEDESAASLLLEIATSPPLLPWSSRSPPHLNFAQSDAHTVPYHTREVRHDFLSGHVHAQTPSSLLGLDIGSTLTRRP